MTGAGPYIDPPFARTPFSVVNARLVSNSHTTDPSVVENPRIAPSFDGEKTTPGMTVTAENWAPLQARFSLPHFSTSGGGVYQARAPVTRSTACNPPGSGL